MPAAFSFSFEPVAGSRQRSKAVCSRSRSPRCSRGPHAWQGWPMLSAIRNGEITLVAPPALTTRFLAQALSPLLAEQPDIHFTMRSLPSPRIIDLVAAQQVDIGLSVLPFEHPNVDAERLMRFEMVCVLPGRHPLADKSVIDLEDLGGDPFVSLARDDCSLMTIDRAFQIKGVQKRNRIEVPLGNCLLFRCQWRRRLHCAFVRRARFWQRRSGAAEYRSGNDGRSVAAYTEEPSTIARGQQAHRFSATGVRSVRQASAPVERA